MDYQKHYTLLAEKAKKRVQPEGYFERHHIIPRCMGGLDDEDNLICLTAEEHYIAHLLLVKIYPDEPKLVYAANMMCVDRWGNRVNNKRFGWLKKEVSRVQSERMKGHIKSPETRAKLSAANKGKKRSKEYSESLSKRQLGRKLPESTKLKISLANKGKIHTDEFRKNQSIRFSGENNPMYGLKGSDHPAFGTKPWRSGITLKSNANWIYALSIYDYYVQDTKHNPFNKKVGHKRILKDFNIKDSGPIRHAIEKITMENWNPYDEPDLLVWAEENGYKFPDIDISKFRFQPAFKYAFEIYDWVESKKSNGQRCGTKHTQFYIENPNMRNIEGITNSHIVYILEDLIQKQGWSPYEDLEFKEWIQKWHS